MIKAIVADEMLEKIPKVSLTEPPPEIPPGNNIFEKPALTKLAFFDKQIKWLMTQDISDSFKARLYQDTLSKAGEVYKNITNKKTAVPVETEDESIDLEKNKNEIELLKNELLSLKKQKKKRKKVIVSPKHSPIAGRTKSKLRGIQKKTRKLDVYGGFKL